MKRISNKLRTKASCTTINVAIASLENLVINTHTPLRKYRYVCITVLHTNIVRVHANEPHCCNVVDCSYTCIEYSSDLLKKVNKLIKKYYDNVDKISKIFKCWLYQQWTKHELYKLSMFYLEHLLFTLDCLQRWCAVLVARDTCHPQSARSLAQWPYCHHLRTPLC